MCKKTQVFGSVCKGFYTFLSYFFYCRCLNAGGSNPRSRKRRCLKMQTTSSVVVQKITRMMGNCMEVDLTVECQQHIKCCPQLLMYQRVYNWRTQIPGSSSLVPSLAVVDTYV